MKDISFLTKNYDEKINNLKEFDGDLNFMFVCDCHNRFNQHHAAIGERETPDSYENMADHVEAMRYVIERFPKIDYVVCGGDIANDYFHQPDQVRCSLIEAAELLYSLPAPVHNIIGNHDDAVGTSTERGYDNSIFAITPDQMHKYIMKNNPTDENYYYIDHEKSGYRLVFLNSSDYTYIKDENGQYTHGHSLEFSQKQIDWFKNDALNTDKKVIVFSHGPLTHVGLYEEGQGIGRKDYPKNITQIKEILKESKNVKAIIAGHLHDDNFHYLEEYEYLASFTSASTFLDPQVNYIPKRVLGTESETAFDVFSIKNDVMHVTRFGWGADRTAYLLR